MRTPAKQPIVCRACGQPASRRRQLLGAAVLSAAVISWSQPPPATASLVQFPCDALNNKYVLVRAGESYSEADNVVLTNPAWKTSMAAGLSERGKAQVIRQTIPSMETLGICGEAGCWLWPSVTQNSYQTAEILAGVLGVGRNRIVPEYSFLDARGVGALEGLRLGTVYQQVWDGDGLDSNWHPPKGYDGTPPESAADVLTRMRQLLSVTETQYTGEDVVIIAPDSDTLSILQAAVIGLDLRRHSELAMKPGEVRPLLLSRQKPDTQPRTIPCPRPPACV